MQLATRPRNVVVVAVVVIIMALGFWWNSISAQLAVEAKGLLVNQVNQALNGKIEIAALDISLSKIIIRQVTIFDKQGAVLGKCSNVVMAFGFWDFLHGRIGLETVKEITVEEPVLTMVQSKDGTFNITTLFKPVSADKPKYKGSINFLNGTATIKTPADTVQLENIRAVLVMEDDIALALQQATLVYGGQKILLKGRVDELTTAIKLSLDVSAKEFDLAAVGQGFGQAKGSFTAKVEGTALKPVVKGNFEKFGGSFSGNTFSGGKGAFQYADGNISFDQVEAKALGGSVQLTGTVRTSQPQALKLYVNVYGVDSAQLTGSSGDLPLKGIGNFYTSIEGTPVQPVISGKFDVDSGMVKTTAFSGAKGAFKYAGGVLALDQVEATAIGGRVQAIGTVNLNEPRTMRLYVNVYGVDSAKLADDIAMQGIGNYYTVLEGSPVKPLISGKFEIDQGVVRNVPFAGANGQFRLTDTLLYIDQAAAGAMGGTVSFVGTVQLDGTGGYNMRASGNSLDIKKLIAASQPPNIKSAPPDIAGRVSLQANITGANVVTYAEGTYSMASGVYANTTFTNATGAFRYDGQKLIFDNARANMNGGVVSGGGTLGVANDEYVLTVAGTGLECSQLTDKQVQGKVAFNANAQGTGDFDKAVVQGTFKMGSGTVSGIPFTSAKGNFTRKNGQFAFDAVNFEMLGGLIKGDVVMNGSSFAVKIDTPSGAVTTNDKDLRDRLVQDLLKDKQAPQPTEPPASNPPAVNPPTNSSPPPVGNDILELLKKLQRK